MRELCALTTLVDLQVRFVLIGGHAVAFHAGSRETADVDLLVDTLEPNPSYFYAAVTKIVGHPPAFAEAQLRLPQKHVRFTADGLDLDAMTSGFGASFEEIWNNSVSVQLGGVSILQY